MKEIQKEKESLIIKLERCSNYKDALEKSQEIPETDYVQLVYHDYIPEYYETKKRWSLPYRAVKCTKRPKDTWWKIKYHKIVNIVLHRYNKIFRPKKVNKFLDMDLSDDE